MTKFSKREMKHSRRAVSVKAGDFAGCGKQPRLSLPMMSVHAEGMDELEEFKAFLGPAAKGYNDAQLRQLEREMHAMAELLLDLYLQKKTSTGPGSVPPTRFDAHLPNS